MMPKKLKVIASIGFLGLTFVLFQNFRAARLPIAGPIAVADDASIIPAIPGLPSDPANNGVFTIGALAQDTSIFYGDVQLRMQGDGNFVIYKEGFGAVWASMTQGNCGQRCFANFQADGNLVLYNYDGSNQLHSYWSSGTNGPGRQLKLSPLTPYLSILDGAGNQIWTKDAGFENFYQSLDLPVGGSAVIGDTVLVMQGDGNLVVYRQGQALAATGMGPQAPDCSGGCSARFQTDGNLVLYKNTISNPTSPTPYWSSHTDGNTNGNFRLHFSPNAPYLSVVDGAGSIAWDPNGGAQMSSMSWLQLAAGTMVSNGTVHLAFQGDGNLVVYKDGQGAVWASGTSANCASGCNAVFQTDGNLVLYDASGNAYWNVYTGGNEGQNWKLRLSQNAPYLTVADALGSTRWQSSESYIPLPVGTDPSVVSWAAGRLDTFYRMDDSFLGHQYFDGAWKTDVWFSGVDSKTTAITWGTGRIDVFFRTADSCLGHQWTDDSQSQSYSGKNLYHEKLQLACDLTGAPTAITQKNSNRIDVYYNSNNRLGHQWWDGSQWHASRISSSPQVLSVVSIATSGDGQNHVFYRTAGNHLGHSWGAGANHSSETLDTGVTGAPQAVFVPASNRFDVFYESNKQLGHQFFTGGWSTELLGGYLTSDPTVSNGWGGNRLDIFYQSGQVLGQHYSPDSVHYIKGILMATAGGGSPSVVSWNAGRYDIFYATLERSLGHIFYEGGWGGPEALNTVVPAAIESFNVGTLPNLPKITNGSVFASDNPLLEVGMTKDGNIAIFYLHDQIWASQIPPTPTCQINRTFTQLASGDMQLTDSSGQVCMQTNYNASQPGYSLLFKVYAQFPYIAVKKQTQAEGVATSPSETPSPPASGLLTHAQYSALHPDGDYNWYVITSGQCALCSNSASTPPTGTSVGESGGSGSNSGGSAGNSGPSIPGSQMNGIETVANTIADALGSFFGGIAGAIQALFDHLTGHDEVQAN